MGLVSSVSLIYFYTVQRNFTKNHREFLLTLSNLNNAQSDLKSEISLNSLYAYTSEDEAARDANKLQNYLVQLKESTILNSKEYVQIVLEINELEKEEKKALDFIEQYNMLNAAIKNSLVFLVRHVDNAFVLNKTDQQLYMQANKIIQKYNNTKKIQDLDYIDKDNYFLTSDSKDERTQNFIKKFNQHSAFVFKNFPQYMEVSKNVLNNSLSKEIDIIRNDFSQIALNDFKSLDRFALILFLTFILSFALIVFLMLRYINSNKKLLQTTASLEHSLNYDLLTDLHNRHAFERDLFHLLEPHLLILNIDDFKQVNDIYGNDVGNVLLIKLSAYIKDITKNIKNVKIYRIGGDEFGLLFNNINSNQALDFAYLLEEKISQRTFKVNLLNLNITVSIASNNIKPIFENADLALKEVKKDKTVKVIEYKECLNLKQSIEENLKILDIIKKAILHDRVTPYYQPIVNLTTSKIDKYEALVRIIQDNGLILTPDKFLEISKKTKHYHEITKIMIEKTLRTAKEYPKYRFSINISMLDILDQDIVDILFNALDKDLSVSSRIDIELLESELLEQIGQVQNFITRLHSYGSQVLIDDFGSGYSNFSYFADLDIDIVKIDGSIVGEITTNERKKHMLKSIYQFSQGMDLQNVAEFVETREIALLLKEIGVTYAQGYYFSKPIPKPLENNKVII